MASSSNDDKADQIDKAMDLPKDKPTTEKIPATESKSASDWNQLPQDSTAKGALDYLTGNAHINIISIPAFELNL